MYTENNTTLCNRTRHRSGCQMHVLSPASVSWHHTNGPRAERPVDQFNNNHELTTISPLSRVISSRVSSFSLLVVVISLRTRISPGRINHWNLSLRKRWTVLKLSESLHCALPAVGKVVNSAHLRAVRLGRANTMGTRTYRTAGLI